MALNHSPFIDDFTSYKPPFTEDFSSNFLYDFYDFPIVYRGNDRISGYIITTSLFSLTGIIVRLQGIIPKWPNNSDAWIIVIYPDSFSIDSFFMDIFSWISWAQSWEHDNLPKNIPNKYLHWLSDSQVTTGFRLPSQIQVRCHAGKFGWLWVNTLEKWDIQERRYIYNVGPPSYVWWFINPMNTIVLVIKSIRNHSYWSSTNLAI